MKNKKIRVLVFTSVLLVFAIISYSIGYFITGTYKTKIVESYDSAVETVKDYYYDLELKVLEELDMILPDIPGLKR